MRIFCTDYPPRFPHFSTNIHSRRAVLQLHPLHHLKKCLGHLGNALPKHTPPLTLHTGSSSLHIVPHKPFTLRPPYISCEGIRCIVNWIWGRCILPWRLPTSAPAPLWLLICVVFLHRMCLGISASVIGLRALSISTSGIRYILFVHHPAIPRLVRVQSLTGPCRASSGARVAGISSSKDALDSADEAISGPTCRFIGRWRRSLIVFHEGNIGSPAGSGEAKAASSELGIHLFFFSSQYCSQQRSRGGDRGGDNGQSNQL